MTPDKLPHYSLHAIERMMERHITKAEVEFVLNNPEETRSDPKGNIIQVAFPGGRRIKIVVSRDSSNFIITAAD
ncbi:MAG: DUF4258 domain-containing protein [Dehalogenimonas sp.]|uniref:DUF4258 domain-containing protein n=1 Tax=Candidatus Dehalogenimonas loeffleri TaxID=3127115 RepID=A0ABZ2J4X7_9CHLR|nr:DUF4258 domain-containing protein [Dehalogenimonas sp.]